MAKAYYGSRISANMTQTPEGFLICHNVPIARTGTQKYLAREIGLEGNDIVTVYRTPEEVFDKKTIASFEGKVFTDEHPNGWITPDNALLHTKGVISNVRKGTGEEDDLLLADIIVYSKDTIDKIKSDHHQKREVSCGYECEYEKFQNGYKQVDIIGNHVSLVEAGRAGERVAIKDSDNISETITKTNNERRNYSMSNYKLPSRNKSNITEFLKAVGLKAVVQDSEPEDILNVVDELAEEKMAEKEIDQEPVLIEREMEEEGVKDQDGDYAVLEEKINRALSLIESLLEEEKEEPYHQDEEMEEPDEEMEALDELEEELAGEEGGDQMEEEESVTVEPEEITDEEPVYNGEKVLNTAYDSALVLLRQFKPIIAAMPNKSDRKRATDALIKQVKKVAKTQDNTYAKLNNKSQAKDSSANVDKTFIGQEIAQKFNPHYKK